MTIKITETMVSQINIKCKLCNAEIMFDANDTSSFLSKTEHQDFFGMMLVTYRIQHVVNGEKHLNAVLIDKQNLFRGYIDAYTVPVLQEEQPLSLTEFNNYLFLEENIESLPPNDVMTNFFVVNFNGWILEAIKTNSINTDAFLTNVFEKIEESRKIYNIIPQPLSVVIANLECYIWVVGNTHLIVTTQKKETIENFAILLGQIAKGIDTNSIIPKKKTFKILTTILMETDLAEKRADLVLRLLTDDLYYSNIQTRYPERISEIIPKISKRHSLPEVILEDLLLGKVTLIELFEEKPEFISQCKAIIETLDFINRRNLLI